MLAGSEEHAWDCHALLPDRRCRRRSRTTRSPPLPMPPSPPPPPPLTAAPTVGWACINYHKLYRRPRGMYFSANDRGEMVSAQWGQQRQQQHRIGDAGWRRLRRDGEVPAAEMGSVQGCHAAAIEAAPVAAAAAVLPPLSTGPSRWSACLSSLQASTVWHWPHENCSPK